MRETDELQEKMMTHPHEALAQKALELLSKIGGVFAVAVRAHPEPPKTPTEIREEIEASYDGMVAEGRPVDDLFHGTKQEWVDTAVRDRTKELARHLATSPAPFPHLTEGASDLAHYLRGLTDLLGPDYDERIDARVGATRMVAESWDHLIVAVALPVSDVANKSLSRGLKRVRRKMERL